MQITFRSAKPEDVEEAVPLIYASGPAAFEYVFQVSETIKAHDFLRYAFVRPGSEFSYTNHTCMVGEDGHVVGIGAAFSEEASMGFTISALKYIIGFYGIGKGIGVIRRGLAIEKIIAPPKGNTEVLVHLAVKPTQRGRGLGFKLIQYFMEQAQLKERETVSLDVSIENPIAMALYERIGFKITKENTSKLKSRFSYVPTHFKMHMPL